MIQIQGLTKRQATIADVMFNKCHTQSDVAAVLEHYGQDARTVYELLTAAALDQYMETDLAAEYLSRFQS